MCPVIRHKRDKRTPHTIDSDLYQMRELVSSMSDQVHGYLCGKREGGEKELDRLNIDVKIVWPMRDRPFLEVARSTILKYRPCVTMNGSKLRLLRNLCGLKSWAVTLDKGLCHGTLPGM
jgi:hypothetical protein